MIRRKKDETASEFGARRLRDATKPHAMKKPHAAKKPKRAGKTLVEVFAAEAARLHQMTPEDVADLLNALRVAALRAERDAVMLTAERDALAASLATLREAARRFYASMMPVSFAAGIYAERGSGLESRAVVAEAYSAADHCDTIIAATSSPAEHGARVIAASLARSVVCPACGYDLTPVEGQP
jgi:hypothetical protein